MPRAPEPDLDLDLGPYDAELDTDDEEVVDDRDVVRMRRERGGPVKVLLVLGVIVALFATLVVGARSWYQRQVDPPGPPGEEVDIAVPNGAALTDLGSLLGDADVVSNATLFRFWIRDKDIELQAGTYEFRRRSSFEEVEEVLRGSPQVVATTDVVVPEGLTVSEIVERIHSDVPRFAPEDILAALADPANRSRFLAADQPSLEGMLFPSTYEVSPTDSPASLVGRMVDEMERQAEAAGIDTGLSGDNLPPLSPYQLLTVASLIERETGNPQESPQIARVIYNRILDGMPLQIDATSRYLAESTGQPFDLDSPSPYNTRRQRGLPPTPIAAPSTSSLDAALNPATGDWLYYVLESEDSHFFTADYQEFLTKRDECEQAGLGCGA